MDAKELFKALETFSYQVFYGFFAELLHVPTGE